MINSIDDNVPIYGTMDKKTEKKKEITISLPETSGGLFLS